MDAINKQTYPHQVSQERLNKANKELPKLGELGLALVQIKLQELTQNKSAHSTSDYVDILNRLHEALPKGFQTQLNVAGFQEVGPFFAGNAKEKVATLLQFFKAKNQVYSQSNLPSSHLLETTLKNFRNDPAPCIPAAQILVENHSQYEKLLVLRATVSIFHNKDAFSDSLRKTSALLNKSILAEFNIGPTDSYDINDLYSQQPSHHNDPYPTNLPSSFGTGGNSSSSSSRWDAGIGDTQRQTQTQFFTSRQLVRQSSLSESHRDSVDQPLDENSSSSHESNTTLPSTTPASNTSISTNSSSHSGSAQHGAGLQAIADAFLKQQNRVLTKEEQADLANLIIGTEVVEYGYLDSIEINSPAFGMMYIDHSMITERGLDVTISLGKPALGDKPELSINFYDLAAFKEHLQSDLGITQRHGGTSNNDPAPVQFAQKIKPASTQPEIKSSTQVSKKPDVSGNIEKIVQRDDSGLRTVSNFLTSLLKKKPDDDLLIECVRKLAAATLLVDGPDSQIEIALSLPSGQSRFSITTQSFGSYVTLGTNSKSLENPVDLGKLQENLQKELKTIAS